MAYLSYYSLPVHRAALFAQYQFTSTGIGEDRPATPLAFGLSQNYPNPFNPGTTISFQLPESGPVSLEVYNVLGQQVARLVDEVKASGTYAVTFDGTRFASGTYIYQLRDGRGQMQARRMLLVK